MTTSISVCRRKVLVKLAIASIGAAGLCRYIVLTCLLVMVLIQGGCISTHVGMPVFSADSQKVAYLWEEKLDEPVSLDAKTWFRTIHLRWCPADAPQRMSSVVIRRVGLGFAGSDYIDKEVQWSPDGTHIGVLTVGTLVIVEASSLTKKEVRDREITSFAWLSDTELGYCAKRRKGDLQRRVICRQKLGAATPTEVIAFDWSDASVSTRKDFWSPSGQYVVFVEPASGGRYHLVNMDTGTSFAFGQRNAHALGAAWAVDSSKVFCISDQVGPYNKMEAILLDPATRTTVNCSSGFMATFANQWPTVEPVWTADGKYVIANALDSNAHLVQPDPWKAIPLSETLVPRLSPPTQTSSITPWLLWLPVPGWVGVVPTGNRGSSPTIHVSNYKGNIVKPLLETGMEVVSPDGTKAAIARHENGQVTVRDLGRWWLTPSDTARSE